MIESNRGAPSFKEALRTGGLVGDGGMGTELLERGMPFSISYEALNRSRPEVVRGIHDEFLRAGADVVATNTFGANAIRLARHGLENEVRAINRAGAKLARSACLAWTPASASGSRRAYVAGSMGPTGLAFGDDSRAPLAMVRAAFRAQAEALAEEGVDLLVIETMRHPRELLLAVDAVRDAVGTSIPLVAQMSVDAAQEMADGLPALSMATKLRDRGVDALGVNCSTGPHDVGVTIEKLLALRVPLTASPNAGLPAQVQVQVQGRADRFVYAETPHSFGAFARRMFSLGVCLVGGCCGTTSAHIRSIAAESRRLE
jgi:methionine synthase I (cobalamin-dependent)